MPSVAGVIFGLTYSLLLGLNRAHNRSGFHDSVGMGDSSTACPCSGQPGNFPSASWIMLDGCGSKVSPRIWVP